VTAEPFREAVRSMLRDRLLDAAAQAFSEEGWRRLTMVRVADRAGVSRQTVYNEFGNKQQLAEQLVMRELDTFLDIVRQRVSAETEFVPAVRSAIHGALEAAENNALLRSVLESGHTGDTDLLPFIFQSQGIIDRATSSLVDLVTTRFRALELPAEHLAVALESVVRLVLSHITQPSRTPDETADALAFMVGAVVDGTSVG
jgi:AcrR family transcriptional regulator